MVKGDPPVRVLALNTWILVRSISCSLRKCIEFRILSLLVDTRHALLIIEPWKTYLDSNHSIRNLSIISRLSYKLTFCKSCISRLLSFGPGLYETPQLWPPFSSSALYYISQLSQRLHSTYRTLRKTLWHSALSSNGMSRISGIRSVENIPTKFLLLFMIRHSQLLTIFIV